MTETNDNLFYASNNLDRESVENLRNILATTRSTFEERIDFILNDCIKVSARNSCATGVAGNILWDINVEFERACDSITLLTSKL